MSTPPPPPGAWPDADRWKAAKLWPNALRTGEPLNPRQSGWHWWGGKPAYWDAETETWEHPDYGVQRLADVGDAFCLVDYEGPCLTPAQHQADLAAARERIRELVDDLDRRAKACDDMQKQDDTRSLDRMRLYGKAAAYSHAAELARTTLAQAADR